MLDDVRAYHALSFALRRYSDFIVNEVGLDGTVARLADCGPVEVAPPDAPEAAPPDSVVQSTPADRPLPAAAPAVAAAAPVEAVGQPPAGGAELLVSEDKLAAALEAFSKVIGAKVLATRQF